MTGGAWQGHAHFFAKIKIEYLKKIILHQTAYNLEKKSQIFHASSVRLRSVTEPHPFFGFDFN